MKTLTSTSPHRHSLLVMGVISIGLSVTGVWTAWDDGGGKYETQFIAACAVLFSIPLGLWVSFWRWRSGERLLVPWLVMLGGLIAILGWLQSQSWSRESVLQLSPGCYAAYQEWIPSSLRSEVTKDNRDDSQGVSQKNMPLSVAPEQTRIALSVPLGFAITTWLASLCFRSIRWGILLVMVPSIAGTLFAFFGLADALVLARDTTEELRQRLIISPIGADHPFGPFVNNNNAAGYLLLCMACAFALLSWCLQRGDEPKGEVSPSESERNTPYLKHAGRVLGCAIMIIVMAAGVLGSESRGGFLGMIAGALACLVAFRGRLHGRRYVSMLLGIVVIAAIAWFFLYSIGINEQVAERLQTLNADESLQNPRLAHWKDAMVAAGAYFPMGAGLGSYRYAYLPYQNSGGPLWFLNADGMPIEWMVEGGVWLLPVVLTGCGLWISLLIRRARIHEAHSDGTLPKSVGDRIAERSAPEDLRGPMITASSFAIAAMAVNQCFDFGFLHPPLFLTCALIAGGTVAVNERVPSTGQSWGRFDRGGWRSTGLLFVFVSVLAAGYGWVTCHLYAGGVVQSMEKEFRAKMRQPLIAQSSFDPEIIHVEKLLRKQPGNPMAHELIARLLLAEQSRLGAEYLHRNNLASPAEQQRFLTVRNVRRAFYMNHGGHRLSMEELLLPSQELARWRLAREHAVASLLLCPLNDGARVAVIDLDMLSLDAPTTTPILLGQAAKLRQRNRNSLQLIQSLAESFPGIERVPEIGILQERLR